jgi:hypothetical protein
VACSACGGNERRPISPGYWECTTLRSEPPTWVPAGHGGQMVPRADPPRPCGNRYHDGPTTPTTADLCSCKTFAIGRCAGCDVYVCGDHSSLFEDRRLCASCWQATEASIAARRLTISKFLELAASVGKPGMRTWRVVTVTSIEGTTRRGLLRTRTPTFDWVLTSRSISGWLFDGPTPKGELLLTEDGRVHRYCESTDPLSRWRTELGQEPEEPSRSPLAGMVAAATWAKTDAVKEDKVHWDWLRGVWSSPERIDEVLRAMCSRLEIEAPQP